MDNIVKIVEKFLAYSDYELEELAKKNELLKIQKDNERDSDA